MENVKRIDCLQFNFHAQLLKDPQEIYHESICGHKPVICLKEREKKGKNGMNMIYWMLKFSSQKRVTTYHKIVYDREYINNRHLFHNVTVISFIY